MWERESRRRRQERRQSDEAAAEHPVLALQRAAGNAAVTARLARKPATLEDWEQQEGVEHVDRLRLDDPHACPAGSGGHGATGWFKRPDAQALGQWRVQHGLPRGGKLSPRALDAQIRAQSSAGMHHDLIHLVADYYDLDLRAGTLSVRFDPALTTALPRSSVAPGSS